MVAAYRTFYEKLSPDEAEQDLQATLQADPLARALVTKAKAQVFSTLYPDRPLPRQVPAAQPAAAAPAPVTPAAPEPAALAAPDQGRAPTPQARVIERYMQFYETMNDADLAQEAGRLAKGDPTGMDVLTSYRAQAVQRVRQARQQAAEPQAAHPPEVPAPPVQTTPQQALAYFRGKYLHLSSDELRAEAKRLMASDPLGRSVPTSLRLSVIQALLTQRQATTSPRTPAADDEP